MGFGRGVEFLRGVDLVDGGLLFDEHDLFRAGGREVEGTFCLQSLTLRIDEDASAFIWFRMAHNALPGNSEIVREAGNAKDRGSFKIHIFEA